MALAITGGEEVVAVVTEVIAGAVVVRIRRRESMISWNRLGELMLLSKPLGLVLLPKNTQNIDISLNWMFIDNNGISAGTQGSKICNDA